MRLFIDSTYRISGTEYDYIFRSKDWTMNSRKRIRLLEAKFQKVAYTVTTGFNDELFFTDGGTPDSITIPEDNYTMDELATQLTTLMTAEIGTFTVTYDESKNKFTFDNGSGATVVFPAVGLQNVQSATESSHDIYKLLGLDNSNALTITTGNSSELTNQADGNMLPYVMVRISTVQGALLGVITDVFAYTYAISMNDAKQYDYSIYTEEGSYQQANGVRNFDVNELLIEVFPNSSMPRAKMFHGINHYMVLELTEIPK